MKIYLLRPSSIALFGLFLLFPGFYFYNVLLAAGMISAITSGYFEVMSIILLGGFLMYLGKTVILGRYAPLYVGTLVILVIWCFLLALFSYFFSSGIYRQEAFMQVVGTVGVWVILYHIGLYSDFERPLLRRLFWASGILIFANIAYYVATTGSIFFNAREIYHTFDNVATYQGFSRSALITAFVCLSLIELRGAKLLLLISTAIFCLFVLGSRSELVAFVFVAALVFMRSFILNPYRVIFPAVGLIILLLVVSSFYTGLSASRQTELFNLDESSSWRARVELSSEAIGRIKQHPLLGEIGGHIDVSGQGRYAHNILSAWDSFGFVGFFLYLTLMLVPAVSATRLALRKKNLTVDEKFFIFIAVSVLLLSLAAKSVFSPMPALAWGLYVRFRIDRARKLPMAVTS